MNKYIYKTKYNIIITNPKNKKRKERCGLGPPINWEIPPNNRTKPINIWAGAWRLYKSKVAPIYMYTPNIIAKVIEQKKNIFLINPPTFL